MIDDIDKRLLKLLQEDARLSNAALAEQVGLTASTVYERVKKLEKRGFIKGYVAVVDAAALGKTITAFIRIILAGEPGEYLAAKENIAAVCVVDSRILECHAVAGEDCYILKVRVATPKELESLLEDLRCRIGILRSISSIVLTTVKETMKIEPDVEESGKVNK